MKKFFVALFLIVGIITVHLFVSEIIYLQIADLLWLFVYGIGLSKILVQIGAADRLCGNSGGNVVQR